MGAELTLTKIKNNFELTPNQKEAFQNFRNFIANKEQKVFILKGYAGTGKTTLIRYFIDEITQHNNTQYILMASTGRAAKILTNMTGKKAQTIHSVIYVFNDFNQDLEEVIKIEDEVGVDKTGQLFLTYKLTPIKEKNDKQIYYIVDEASMISDTVEDNAVQAQFGSGRTLSDLLEYDHNGKFIFVGNECQLPPIGQNLSPALSVDYFENELKVHAVESTLTNIVRQQLDNSIILAAHRIRKLCIDPPQVKWGKLPLGNYQHVYLHHDIVSMINDYIKLIGNRNFEAATLISSSNTKCNNLNKLICTALGHRNTLQEGDLLLVTQNNLISGLMNGDMVMVEQVKKVRYQRAQLSFLLIEVRELVTGRRLSQYIIEDILYGNAPNLLPGQQKALFIDFYRRMKEHGIKQKTPEFHEQLKNDEFLNALRCVYGYAITCHKAQGGEWDTVFVDIPRNLTLNARSADYQWIYTAVTRASKQLHIVNDFFISK
ncbi:MAG: AAA family ATPase [Paludibacteraceae bacterium]|jgi:ATP-dependent exoDNAse (exonuclease V) alpha subunit|nr:AAA family ATPase [Paludibacteraceae bacterium]